MSQYSEEIERRRTFAIISHPDAGKTTLTEKLLLFGGAIHVAGAVKSNKIKKTATSDWMEIEKQRGISVATSVMAFDYSGHKINILDTPGHQDFAEDTFRTLTAVDSVIIVIDTAKGVEAQTRKLMEVCRMRKTPVIVFVNKTDRDGKDPFDLLDEIEEELHINVRPLSWPIDMGQRFRGVYNIYEQKLNLYTPSKQYVTENVEFKDINSPELENYNDSKKCSPGSLFSRMIRSTSAASLGSIVRLSQIKRASVVKSAYNSSAFICSTPASKSAASRLTSRSGFSPFFVGLSCISTGSTYRDLDIMLTASSSPLQSKMAPRGEYLVTLPVT